MSVSRCLKCKVLLPKKRARYGRVVCDRCNLVVQREALTRIIARGRHKESIAALCAFGEAVAYVSRAWMVILACRGNEQRVHHTLPDGCDVCYSIRYNAGEQQSVVMMVDPGPGYLNARVLWRSASNPQGPAYTGAEAVTKMIEIMEELTR